MIRSRVIVQNVIFDVLKILTLTFDLDLQIYFWFLSMPNVVCVFNMFNIGPRMAEKINIEILTWCGNTHTDTQTHRQTGVKQYFANPLRGRSNYITW